MGDSYCTSTGCGWTQDWSCPWQPAGKQGQAGDDGSVGYNCCCKQRTSDSQPCGGASPTPSPVPVPNPVPSPVPTPTPADCPGSNLSDCIAQCPTEASVFQICVQVCSDRCHTE